MRPDDFLMYDRFLKSKTSMPFYKTVGGNEYYYKTLPKLIKSIEHLANSLDKNGDLLSDAQKQTIAENLIAITHYASINEHFPQMVMGHEYFGRTLPKLIRSMENLAEELEAKEKEVD